MSAVSLPLTHMERWRDILLAEWLRSFLDKSSFSTYLGTIEATLLAARARLLASTRAFQTLKGFQNWPKIDDELELTKPTDCNMRIPGEFLWMNDLTDNKKRSFTFEWESLPTCVFLLFEPRKTWWTDFSWRGSSQSRWLKCFLALPVVVHRMLEICGMKSLQTQDAKHAKSILN